MPFFKLAYHPIGTEEDINHFTAARMRITGSGTFRMRMYSLDDENLYELKEMAMSGSTNREPTRIMNVMEQRAAFYGYTNAVNEYVRINRIILFTKQVFTSYPGNV